jgi:ADP-heptose:LPS heptosyltransferase
MTKQKQSYRYRPQKEYVSLPFTKRFAQRIERFNKILTLRILGKILKIKQYQSPVPLDQVSSVLIIRYDALGDMIVTTPLWRILKRLKPSIKIGVAGSFKNLDLLRSDPDIDFLYDYSASSLKEFVSISKETRKQAWDVVLMGNFNQKTRNAIISRLASPNGITATVGSANKEGHQALFSRLVSLPMSNHEMPMTEQLQWLLRETILLPIQEFERPSIIIDPRSDSDTHTRTEDILRSQSLSQYIVLNVDAPAFKRWGLENNLLLADYISATYQDRLIFITSLPSYRTEIEAELAKRSIPRVRYFPTEDIHEMTALIRYSRLVITPDTSIVHLASAENKPVIAFYLAAGEWLPYKVPAFVIVAKTGNTIASIPLQNVNDAVDTMLNQQLTSHQETQIVRL